MSKIERPTPIYDALMILADSSEKQNIIEGGEKEWLYPRLLYGDGFDGKKRARAAYSAIFEIVKRLNESQTLKVTGIRLGSPKLERSDIEKSLVLNGDLMWPSDRQFDSELRIDVGEEEPIRFIEVQVEPVAGSSPVTSTRFEGPQTLSGAERRDDSARLERMSEIIRQGNPVNTAARQVAAAMPDKNTSETSLTARLSRKYKSRMRENN
jgi:hypothetical protein